MTAIEEVLNTINNIKRKGNNLSKPEIISVLESTKMITPHKNMVDSLILFIKNVDEKTNTKVNNSFTNRETQILKIIGQGKSSKEIAIILNLSISTIETHRKNIKKKLKLIGKSNLTEYAVLYNLQY